MEQTRMFGLADLARAYTRSVEAISISTLVLILMAATGQVFFRYVVGASLFWSEEFMRYAIIWMAMLVAGLAFSRGEMIGLDLLIVTLPKWARTSAHICTGMIGIALFLTIAWYGLQLTLRMSATMATALNIPMFYINISIPVGAMLIAIHIALAIFGQAAELRQEK
ncbi:TRAP transporter small permease [Sinorhizobium medicae]|uniref:TRAP transporter small permease n=1 Tax=Sinorhizobium medicae TaxID=110321 RepID=UPI0013E40F75|nr:TRAP transporter small permease [Sinorhizobium medicae]